MKDISFLIFTNEKYFDLLQLTLPYVINNTKHLGKNINVVSNNILNNMLFDGVRFLNANEKFSNDGSHFRNSMIYALNNIDEKYILFLCDDYLIQSPINKTLFQNIITILDNLNVDFLALGTQKHIENVIINWEQPNINYVDFGFSKNFFFEIDTSYRHLYSVQPCIWKKSSLMDILEHNEYLTLHQLDNTDIMNRKGEKRKFEFIEYLFYNSEPNFFDYGFKNLCYHNPPLTYHIDEKPIGSDFFLIDYCEIVRYGKFIETETNAKIILNKILENNIDLKSKLSIFL